VFTIIGGGNATKIHHAAETMTAEEYDALIALAKRLEFSVDCNTRVELEQQISQLNEDLQVASRQKNYARANEIQAALDDLEIHREALPALDELRETVEVLHRDIERAVSAKDFGQAQALSDDLAGAELKVKAEEVALAACNEDDVPGIIVNDKRTRAGLELEIRGLHDELDESIARHDFRSCQDIQASIVELESKRESLSTLSELSHSIASLLAGIDEAVAAKDFASAQQKKEEMEELEQQAAREKASEFGFISGAAVQVGRQLVSLGEQLQAAIKEGHTTRSIDIEQMIREEIRQLEVKFKLDYGSSEEDSNDGVGGGPETLPLPEDMPLGVTNVRDGGDDDRDPQDRILRKITQTGNQGDTIVRTASTVTESRPGAVAVEGPDSHSLDSDALHPTPADLLEEKLRNDMLSVPTVSASARREDGIAPNQVNPGSVDNGTSAPPPASEALPTVDQQGVENSSPDNDDPQSSDAVTSDLRATINSGVNPPMAHAIDTATEEDVVTRIVQEVMARDAVEAVDVVVESPSNERRSRRAKRGGISFFRSFARKIGRRK